jgi:hypothetical protein
MPLVSAASITIDGDGPTQHDDFLPGDNPAFWAVAFTGEASGFVWPAQIPELSNWLEIDGAASSYGDSTQGSVSIRAPLAGVGTTQAGTVSYSPTAPLTGVYGGSSATVTVTQFGPNTLQGSFDAVVQAMPPSTGTKHLTGTFDVCHLPFEEKFGPGMPADGGP